MTTQNLFILIVVILFIFVYIIFFIKRAVQINTELLVIFIMLTLMGLSLILSFIGLYPFGGIRQHLFATPLIFLSLSSIIVYILNKAGLKNIYTLSILFILVVPSSLKNLPSAYAEVTDIGSPINLVSGTEDENVFLTFGSKPSVQFHFPNRNFYYSKSKLLAYPTSIKADIEGMRNEILNMNSSSVYLVFALIQKNEVEGLITLLKSENMQVVLDKKFKESRLIKISKFTDIDKN